MSELSKLDSLIGYLSPSALRNRLYARAQIELMRQFDAAKSFNSSTIRGSKKSANAELHGQVAPIRENVREVLRNTPFAQRGSAILANGIVGWGFEAAIRHESPKIQGKLVDLWKEWNEGKCSVDRTADFNSLQRLAITAVVNDGEVVSRDEISDGSVRLRLLESDYIDDRYNESGNAHRFTNGIVLDASNQPTHYALFSEHPGDDRRLNRTSSLVDASEIIHCFRQDRPEQVRGVSWFAPVIHPLKMLSELQWTQLMRLKLSASISGIITVEPNGALPPATLKKQREEDFELSPGTFHFLNQGESVQFPQIPNPEGFGGTTKLTLLEIASGLGITYEGLAGDWGGVNFSSGRLGDIGFKANVEAWRWGMFEPRFLNPAFKRFQRFSAMRGVDASKATVEWVPPAWPMISPTEEISAANSAMRSGLKSLPGVLREFGIDPEKHLREIAEANKKLDELGLIFDSDPRRTANGQLQSADSLAALKGEKKT